MRDNFAPSLAAVLRSEGGFVNDPRDPGGATDEGVTQTVYDDWRTDQGLAQRSVRDIDQAEVEAIYRKLYWDVIQGDGLPFGVDYCTFDFAVNSGVNRAARFLQRGSGAVEDGHIGPASVATAKAIPPATLIDRICDARLAFLKCLPIFDRFGHGWTSRVEEVRARAKDMAR